MSFIGGMLAAALLGACMACCALTPVLRSKINRLSHELEKRPTQEHLNEALAEKDSRMGSCSRRKKMRVSQSLRLTRTSTHRCASTCPWDGSPKFPASTPTAPVDSWCLATRSKVSAKTRYRTCRVRRRETPGSRTSKSAVSTGCERSRPGSSREPYAGRPEILKKMYESALHEATKEAANTPDIDWRDVELIENGAMIIPKDAPK